MSHTHAAMIPKTGVHSVVVPPHTRMSPGWTRWMSATVVMTRAVPSTIPAGSPGSRRPRPGPSWAHRRGRPDSPNTLSTMIGSGTVSGIVPSMVGSSGPRRFQSSK